jgi:DNA modification methylase
LITKTLDKYLQDSVHKDGIYNIILKEPHERYRKVWKDLLNSSLQRNFKLEFNKKFNPELYNESFYSSQNPFSEEKAISLLESVGWRKNPYEKQHWGVWMHSLSPYQGRITPSFAHWLIKIFSKKGDVVWDSFCGVGTVPFEASLLKRRGLGTDLNPYAHLISDGKFKAGSPEKNLKYLKEIGYVNIQDISIKKIPDWIKAYFHDDTLKEIIYLKKKFEDDKQDFLLGCLMGILHGNRPGYLSVYTGCIIPMKPRGKDHPKFRPDKDSKQYRAAIPRLAAKVMRMFQQPIPENLDGRIFLEDTRNVSLDTNSVDVIISSPPYYNTLDYVGVNKVRLFFLGLDKEKQGDLKEDLIQKKSTYIDQMVLVGKEIRRVLKNNHYLVFILGDVHYTKYSINTAEEIANVYKKIGFEFVKIVNDEIPLNKTASRTTKKKFDRILVMKNIK